MEACSIVKEVSISFSELRPPSNRSAKNLVQYALASLLQGCVGLLLSFRFRSGVGGGWWGD